MMDISDIAHMPLKSLVDAIKGAEHSYYGLGVSTMLDSEYDALYAELVRRETLDPTIINKRRFK